MKAIPVLFVYIIVLLSSCSKEDEVVPLLSPFAAEVVRVEAPATAAVGENVAIKVFFLVDNGCGEFGSFEDTRSGNNITVKVYPRYRGTICHQAFMTLNAYYAFKPEKAGTYTFQFWAGDSQFVTETIVVR